LYSSRYDEKPSSKEATSWKNGQLKIEIPMITTVRWSLNDLRSFLITVSCLVIVSPFYADRKDMSSGILKVDMVSITWACYIAKDTKSLHAAVTWALPNFSAAATNFSWCPLIAYK
jgi:hypothetical protein